MRQIILVSAVAAAIAASASTAGAQQYEARTVAPRTIEHTPQGKLMLGVTGAVLLGLPYAASVWAGATSERSGDRWLYQPVVGPWVALIDRGVCTTPGCRSTTASNTLGLTVDGLAQAAGFAMIIVAVSTATTPESLSPAASTQPTLHIGPASYRAGAGLAAFGTF